MCTLTFVPSGLASDFILTSNRDELVTRRKALFPSATIIANRKVLFPQDEKGGTWIATSSDLTVCLLNGGFEKHIPSPPYRMSRGLIVLNTFGIKELSEYNNKAVFEDIEPFTLICILHQQQVQILEFTWTGEEVYMNEKPGTEPQIWSSVTLYSPEQVKSKQQYFADWLALHPDPTPEQLRSLHQEKFEEGVNKGFSINIDNQVLTVSITSVVKKGGEVLMQYQELFEQAEPLMENLA